jgi:hypothetical protein
MHEGGWLARHPEYTHPPEPGQRDFGKSENVAPPKVSQLARAVDPPGSTLKRMNGTIVRLLNSGRVPRFQKFAPLTIGLVLSMSSFSDASARSRPDHPYRHSVVDIPVSLAIGTARTPQFPVVTHWYWIMVQVEKPLPFLQMQCMMGVTSGLRYPKDCSSPDPVLQANWTVWDDDNMIAQGLIPDRCACMFEDKHIYKFLGGFPGTAGKQYVVEVRFTKNGTALNSANPHLIVIKQGEE